MIPPRENYLAAFPPSHAAGNVTLRPLTLAGAIRLGAEGLDCCAAVPRDKALRAAFILSGESDWKRFLKRTKCGLTQLLNAVETTLNDAYATFIKPKAGEPKPGKRTLRPTPHGLGWPLELAEALCAEYGWSWREAVETPVALGWALLACARQRNGGKFAGLDYHERQYQEDVKAGRAKPFNPFEEA